jgi:shikimate dehydrogenase
MDLTDVTKDTSLCISLSGLPTSIGTRFHNHLYAELGLDFVYKACTTSDIAAAIAGVRALGIRGCGVSMPFKEAVIPLVDEIEPSARAIGSVNTVVNTDGHLAASNTDYLAVAHLVAEAGVDQSLPFTVIGSGGMAKAVVAALRDAGFTDGAVVARNATTGRALADRYGVRWCTEPPPGKLGLLVNATPIGMAGDPAAPAMPVPDEALDRAAAVMEVVAVPARTPLVEAAQHRGLTVITGAEIMALQAAEQFARYTGVRPTAEQIARATAFSRSTTGTTLATAAG